MSNTINVTVELGPESQAKLDQILAALQGMKPNCHSCVETAVQMTIAATTSPEPSTAPEPDHKQESGAKERPADAVDTHDDPAPATGPEVTQADVLALVQKLATPTSSKREQAKTIVKSYADRVSAIPAEEFAEVFDKLTQLDKEELTMQGIIITSIICATLIVLVLIGGKRK